MGIYFYKAVDSKGKTVKGELEARDELGVSTQLAKLGYFPVSIGFKGEKSPPLLERFFKKGFKKASSRSIIVFTRQFATMIKAAVPIVEGLNVLAEQSEEETLSQALRQVIADVQEGHKLSEAMAKHPGVFDVLYVNSIVAGEAGGVLDKVLFRLADVLEEENETLTAMKTALRYPVMVVIALFVAVYVLSVFVMPQFSKIYSGMDAALPLPTQVMVLVSKGFKEYWAVTFPSLVGLFFLLKFLIGTPKGRWWWDGLKFRVPVFGKIYNKIVMLRFASMLNVLYQAGLPILKIFDIVRVTINNAVLGKEVEKIKKDVADGKGISGGMMGSKLFPRMVGYMISIGEKAGALSAMLDSLCEYYTLEVRVALRNLTSLIEPIMTAVLGVVVMGMALAIFMPMWNLISVVRQSG